MRTVRVQHPRRRQRGFTLLELIVALSLTVLITLAVFGALQLAARAGEKGSAHSDRTNEIRVVRDWMRRQIEHARPIRIKNESGETVVAFWGEGAAVRFIAPLPAHLGGGGLSLVTLGIDEQRSPLELTVTYRLFHPDVAEDTHRPEQKVLLDAIEYARFRFYGAVDKDEAPTWHARWDSVEFMPSLIALEIGFEARPGTDWITLIAAPMVDGGARPGTILINELAHDKAAT